MPVSKDRIRASFLEQAKLTQAHAWLALGLPGANVSERMEELQSDRLEVLLKGADQLIETPSALAERCKLLRSASLEDAWRLTESDALQVKGVITDPNTDGTNFDAEVRFHFEAEPARLPPISRIEIVLTGRAEKPRSAADLVKSRLLSTNHRWHTLVEDPHRTPEPFKELLGERFKMEFGHGSVTSYEELQHWVYGSASSVNASRHDIESVTWHALAGNEFEAIFVLDWLGLDKDDKKMAAKTKHTWTLSDNLSEPYPRIEHMDVHFLEPFSVIE